MIVRASQFGLDGVSAVQLPLGTSAAKVKKALTFYNETFAQVEKRKDYETHVRAGRREGVFFENEIPYGEDRDGDGAADQKGKGQGKANQPRGKGMGKGGRARGQ